MKYVILALTLAACEMPKQTAAVTDDTPKVETADPAVAQKSKADTITKKVEAGSCAGNDTTNLTFENSSVHNSNGIQKLVFKDDCSVEIAICNQKILLPENLKIKKDETVHFPISIETVGMEAQWDGCKVLGKRSCDITLLTFNGGLLVNIQCSGEQFSGTWHP